MSARDAGAGPDLPGGGAQGRAPEEVSGAAPREVDLDAHPASARPARRSRGWAWALGAPVVGGVLVGLAWWLLAPTAPVRAAMSEDVLLVQAPDAPELFAAQDGTLVLLGAAAGIVTGLVVVLRARRRPLTATVLAAAGSLAGSALAVALGRLLGPASLASQGFRPAAAAADQPDLVSPLSVHAPGALLVWPLLALVVAALGHAVVASRLGRRARRPEAAQDVGSGESVPAPGSGG